MTSNIHEQSKEIAIMRALGMSRAWMYRVYIYESFVLVVASSFLGIIIGTFP
jgi:ABC-type antimicrobial peptide transport system permease subunit